MATLGWVAGTERVGNADGSAIPQPGAEVGVDPTGGADRRNPRRGATVDRELAHVGPPVGVGGEERATTESGRRSEGCTRRVVPRARLDVGPRRHRGGCGVGNGARCPGCCRRRGGRGAIGALGVRRAGRRGARCGCWCPGSGGCGDDWGRIGGRGSRCEGQRGPGSFLGRGDRGPARSCRRRQRAAVVARRGRGDGWTRIRG